MIEAGAARVHYEDQLASEKKCGHLEGKALVPTSQFVRTLVAARLAADVWTCRDPRGAHRRASPSTAHERHRRWDDGVLTGERPGRVLRIATGSTRRSPAGSRTRRTRTSSGSRPRRPIWARRRSSPEAMHEKFPGSSSRTTARRRSTGGSTGRRRRSPASRRTRRLGLPLPVHHARRLPLAERRDVRAGARIRRRADVLVRALQQREFALEEFGYSDAPPARGRRRLLRPRHAGRIAGVDARAEGLHRGGAVQRAVPLTA